MKVVRTASRVLTLASILAALPVQAAPEVDPEAEEQAAPVVVDGLTLFRLHGTATDPASHRAERISERIATAGADESIVPSSLHIAESAAGSEILAGSHRIMLVSDADADRAAASRPILAGMYRGRIVEAIERYREDRSPAVLTRALFAAAAILAGLAVVIGLFVRLWRRLDEVLENRLHRRIHDLRIKSFKLVDAELIWNVLRGTVRTIRALLVITGCFVAAGLALRQFPWTRGAVGGLVSYLAAPLWTMGGAVAGMVPNLIFLALLVVIVRWVLKLARLFFAAVKTGTVTLGGFDPGWAETTYSLVRIAVIAFALVVAYPHIPGSGSDAFKAISILAGVVLSLGSSSVLSSIIAGYAMTYRRTFRVGDTVRIGEVLGEVEQIGLMVTRVRTIKNEEAVIPNSNILQNEVLNYSAHARESGLILHARVGIGYEVPWRQVEAMLLLAADRTRGMRREPRPFILQLGLKDFCVDYELNVYCDEPRSMLQLYTELYRNVLDAFNEYGVQIMT
ncbi:MAG: mechanosensitive ion channel family protein, partial [Myxococcales bacterium]